VDQALEPPQVRPQKSSPAASGSKAWGEKSKEGVDGQTQWVQAARGINAFR